MINSLQVFSYKDSQVRTYTDENDEVWFVAKDVCDILEHTNSRMAVQGLDADEKGVRKVYTPSGDQDMTVVSEPGLYKLIMRSNKPQAKEFTRWVTHEVLPAIRKTGSYTAQQAEHELSALDIRAAEVLQKLASMLPAKGEQREVVREAVKLVTGIELKQKTPEPAKHTPRHWTAEQIGKKLGWPADAVMNRAENLGLTRKARNGWWDGGTWNFTNEGRQKLLDLVWKKVVKIEDGYEYYESGGKMIHWEFDPDAARI